jgi:hypothetical protein
MWNRYVRLSYKQRRKDRNFVLQLLGFLVLSVYTIFTGHMACSNQKSADAAKSAADSAKSAAETAASQLELSERPWVKVDAVVDGP